MGQRLQLSEMKWNLDKCSCGYQPKNADANYIEDFDVVHVRCYECGREWVE